MKWIVDKGLPSPPLEWKPFHHKWIKIIQTILIEIGLENFLQDQTVYIINRCQLNKNTPSDIVETIQRGDFNPKNVRT